MINDQEILIRLLVSALIGAIIGLERERHDQPAGLRTHTILAIGATLAMTLSINLAMQFQPLVPNGDPARLAAQVVSGIGFLGAGAILRYGTNVKGLTTATSLWTIAIIGLAIGAGHYIAAAGTAVLLLITLTILNYVEKRFIRPTVDTSIQASIIDRPGAINDFKQVLANTGKTISSLAISRNMAENKITLEAIAKGIEGENIAELINALSQIDGMIHYNIN